MNFKDIYFSKSKLFSVGIEEDSGKYYISIPVSNGLVDYEEYYVLSNEVFNKFSEDFESLEYLADECRKHQRDNDLFLKPGSDRGVPR